MGNGVLYGRQYGSCHSKLFRAVGSTGPLARGKDYAAACCCAAASAALMLMTMARDGQAAPKGCIAQQTLQKVVLDLF